MAKIVCNDGFSMSVIAGDETGTEPYSSPRTGPGPFCAVEVGYPSGWESLLLPYIDGDRQNPTMSVYGYVPTEVLLKLLRKHGGIKSGTLPPLVQ